MGICSAVKLKKLAAAAAGLLVIGAATAQESGVLNVYNWADYISPDTIQNFEK